MGEGPQRKSIMSPTIPRHRCPQVNRTRRNKNKNHLANHLLRFPAFMNIGHRLTRATMLLSNARFYPVIIELNREVSL